MSDSGQLDLFRGPLAEPDGPEAAAPSAEHEALSRRLSGGVRLGTSSWSFPGWKGLVYRGEVAESRLARDGLAAYARHPLLSAVGIDRTFYSPVAASDFVRYASQVPERFRFLVKASAAVTSASVREGGAWAPNLRFLDSSLARDTVVGPAVEGLGGRLGTLLFQFPPLPRDFLRDAAAFAGRLGTFLDALPRGPVYSVEIRNRELLGPDYARALASAGAAHGFTVHPSMPSLEEQAAVVGLAGQPALVVRWMLGHGRGYEEARDLYAPFDRLAAPDPASRLAIARLATSALRGAKEVLVIVNNKAEGSSPLSVIELARELARGRC